MNGLDVIAGTVRGDLGSSLRLALRAERWFVMDLLGGVAGYAIWVAGTAALGLQVATLAEYEVAPGGGPPTWPVLALVVLLWIGLPAVAGAAHLRSRVLNIRGNIDRTYRVDEPGMLLAAPVAFLVVLSLGSLAASGAIAAVLAAAVLPATVYFLVRTAAFSYRVYAFSRPAIVHLATFVSLTVQASVGLAYLGLANGQRPLVQGAADRLGFGDVFADVDLVVASAPYLITMAVFVPVALATAYLLLQRVAVFVARRQDGSVSATSLRTGQRYPPWWEGDPAGMTTSPGRGHTGNPGATEGAGASAANGGVASGEEAAVDDRGAGDIPDHTPIPDDLPEEPGSEPMTSTVENDSHTRVYTPPEDELDDVPDPADLGTGQDDDSDADAAEDAGDVTGEPTEVVDDETCWSCGATIPADSNASYCPQCGERIV